MDGDVKAKGDESGNSNARTEAEVIRFMGAYWLYQDQIGWNRTQTLVVIEAGILAAAFSRQNHVFSSIILLAGAVLIFCIFRLILRDWQIRDYLKDQLQSLFGNSTFKLVPETRGWAVRGRVVVKLVVWSLITFNICVAVLKLSAFGSNQLNGKWENVINSWLT